MRRIRRSAHERLAPPFELAPERTTPPVRVDDLVVRQGCDVVLDRVTLTVDWDTVAVAFGDSGPGKTALLRAIAGDLPFEGRIEVAGGAVSPGGGRPPHLRLLPAEVELPSIITAHEYVALAVLATGRDADHAQAATRSALAAVGLQESGRHLVEELSGGQRQRLAVAAVLAAPPWILLADEPTSALDATNREIVLTALRALAASGRAVLIATHDESLAGGDEVVHRLEREG